MGLYCDVLRLPAAAVKACWDLRQNEAQMVAHLQKSATSWVEVDKAWHGVHVLLNPDYPVVRWPAGFLFIGGTLLADRDWGNLYGVDVPDLRAFTPAEVREIHGVLRGVTDRTLLRGYDPDRLTKLNVYPQIWENRSSPVQWLLARFLGLSLQARYLAEQFSLLQKVVEEAAAAGEGLVIKYHQ